MKPLTEKQRKLYDFIKAYYDENRITPTYEEMAKAIGVKSVSSIHVHLKSMAMRGAVEWVAGSTRSIKLLLN
jgi:repressor LexA